MRIWVVLALAGCVGSTTDTSDTSQEVAGKTKCKPHKKHADCGTATATIDVNGGTITSDTGATITIPYGALDTPTTITVSQTTQTAPSGAPVFEFEPEGTVFAKPLTVTIPLPAGVTTGTVYWSKLGSTTEFDPIGGTIDLASNTITAQTFHFSLAYIGEPSPTRTVSGGGSTSWISASLYDIEHTDFSTTQVEATVGDGSGGYTEIAGHAGSAAGLFEIDNVPSGEYILHSGTAYLVTTSNTPDLGRNVGGKRLTQRTPFSASSILNLTVTNLDPWQVGNASDPADEIEWFSTEEDDWDFGTDRFATLSGSDTQVTLPIDVSNLDGSSTAPSEIHGSTQGDRAAVGQLVLQHTASGVPYLAMQRVAQFPSTFDAVSGQTQSLTLSLNPISNNSSLSIDYRGSQLKSVLDTYGNPAHTGPGSEACPANLCGGFAGALAQAYDANDGFFAANADLLLMFDNVGQDIVSGPMYYADTTALGGQWGVLFDARWAMRTIQQLPDTSGRAGIGYWGFPDSVEWTTTLAAAQAGPVTAPLLPPSNITVNNQSFFGGGHDLGGIATITWENPNTGAVQPAFYTIKVTELYVDGLNHSHGKDVATINTPDTSFTFPTFADTSKQILQPGHSYVFSITATASTSGLQADVDRLAASPFKSSIQTASALVSSGIFGDNRGIPAPQIIEDNQSWPLGTAANATSVFWVERGQAPWDPPTARFSGNIWMADLDGSNPHVIATGVDEPLEVAAIGNTVYWTTEADNTGGSGGLWSEDLTSGAITQVAAGLSNPNLLLAAGTDLYFMEGGGTNRLRGGVVSKLSVDAGGSLATDGTQLYMSRGDQVDTMPIDGGALTQLVGGQDGAFEVLTDGAYVYWSDGNYSTGGPTTVNRVPVSGGTPTTLYTGDAGTWFALDANNIYVVGDGFVWSMPKAGGPMNKIAAFFDGDTFGCPGDQMTVAGGALYFTDTCSHMAMYRVPLP
jgi:hypothetical protein